MTRFNDQEYFNAGVGLEFDENVWRHRRRALGAFDYLECQPSHFLLVPELFDQATSFPILVHSSQLSLGSIGLPLDREFLKLTKRCVERTQSPWVSEHMSWTRFKGGDTRHFFLPFLDDEVRHAMATNARELRRATQVPVILENAPRTFNVDVGGPPEPQFLRRVLEDGDAGLLLDIESALTTSKSLGYDPMRYIQDLPLERLVEVHVGPKPVEQDILRFLLETYDVRAVTLEPEFMDLPVGEIRRAIQRIRTLMRHPPQSWLQPPGLRQAESGKGPGGPPASSDQPEARFRLSASLNLRLEDDAVVADDVRAGVSLRLPRNSLRLLAKFGEWSPITQAFDSPETTTAESLGVVRGLISSGMLVKQGTDHAASGGLNDTAWKAWGRAFDYHMAARTAPGQNYLGSDVFAARLIRKAKHDPPPPSFKDYPCHPIYPLGRFKRPRDGGRFADVLLRRRTCRSFTRKPLGRSELSTLLYYTWGFQGTRENRLSPDPFLMKTSPSGGSLHSVEVYPVLLNVQGFQEGVKTPT